MVRYSSALKGRPTKQAGAKTGLRGLEAESSAARTEGKSGSQSSRRSEGSSPEGMRKSFVGRGFSRDIKKVCR